MRHFEKHSKGMQALIDTSEAMLNAMETNGIDPETVANRPEFTVLVHFLKSIIDCLLYTSPSPRDEQSSRMPSSA